MSFRSHLRIAPLVIATVLASACAHKPEQKEELKKAEAAAAEAPKPVLVKTTQAAKEVASKQYVIVNFPAGRYNLTEAEKQKLAAWSVNVPKKGEVKDFEILAWPDREYPSDDAKVSSKDVRLADNRADAIKNFFKKDLITKADLSTHNMAKRPSVFGKLFKSDDFEVKSTFEETGAAPTKETPKNFSTENKASKAIVLVKYE